MPEPYLSIVIPAYNEESRLPPTLERLFAYLPALGKPYEIIIVDDGSRDKTVEVVRALQAMHGELVLLADGINRGRTKAVKRGMAAARGAYILETDADGSVADEAIGRFLRALESNDTLSAVFGSREMLGARKAVDQPPLRVFLGYGFIYLTRLVFWMWRTTDFALGFKMFRHDAARDLFAHQFEPHVVAEAELVYVAKLRKHTCIELPVTWTDNADSRIRPLREIVRSLVGLMRIRWRGWSGGYR